MKLSFHRQNDFRLVTRRPNPFRNFLVLCAGLALALTWVIKAEAQSGGANDPPVTIDTSGGTWIFSEPMGALVTLGGTTRVSGRTPIRLDERISGNYTLNANLPGYETWTGDILIDSARGDKYTLKLNAKKRRKAFLRSLLIPGWGQSYAGKKGKAYTFFLSEIATLSCLYFVNHVYKDRVDDLEVAESAYMNETYEENIPARRREYERRLSKANDIYDWQSGLSSVAIGIFALNVFDVMFITPVGPVSGKLMVSPMQGAVISGEIASPQVHAALSYDF